MYKKEFTNGQFLLFGFFFQEKLSCFQQRIGFLWIFIPMCSRVQVGTTLVFLFVSFSCPLSYCDVAAAESVVCFIKFYYCLLTLKVKIWNDFYLCFK